ncbi:sugar phosphate isomerase/epimerase family protein [[Enterobacter] lignolyticus]|uniref:Xylose isomerase domain-containing protein TIM barrel n=1 Tax=Enterobacter lignolyticus (strain SCF1) TaxID=701347 RepID=E3G5I1_ENTLS|nr:TIM barrel protein [[Enterobacter] lignolyticus]ADO49506.1 Xylose isomerase domain-containing protein TIM barrel [[Enterobacter] lignolyticus SCF1]
MNRLNIGARAHDLSGHSLQDIIDEARKLGLDGLQLAIHKTWEDEWQARDEDAIVANIHHLQCSGLSLFLLASYFNPAHSRPDVLARELERVRFTIAVAGKSGVAAVGSETGSLNDDEWTWHPDNHGETAFSTVEQTLSRLRPSLVAHDRHFLVEAVSDHIIHDAGRLAQLNARLGARFQVTLDLANLLNTGNAARWRDVLEHFLLTHGGRIRLLHFKNFILQDGHKVPVGLEEGIIDYAQVLRTLERFQLSHIPVVVEELTGAALADSVGYLRRLSE